MNTDINPASITDINPASISDYARDAMNHFRISSYLNADDGRIFGLSQDDANLAASLPDLLAIAEAGVVGIGDSDDAAAYGDTYERLAEATDAWLRCAASVATALAK